MIQRSELGRYLRRGFREGTWPLLQRFVVAPRILRQPPIQIHRSDTFEVHMRICERDALLLHWSLRSLLHNCQQRFGVTIHDDGTCSTQTLSIFAEKFPGAKIITRSKAASHIMPLLDSFPNLRQWWPTTYRAIKWLDVYLLGDTTYIIFLDSDVLFFREPLDLFQECSTTVWMRDVAYTLYIDAQESVALFGGFPLPPLNSGLGRMERSRFNLSLAEKVLIHLKQPRDDQTLHAVITAQYPDHDLLPSHAYNCAFNLGLEYMIAKHYTTPFRFWLYEEGIPRVARILKLPLHHWLTERP
jgi:hypothetical protein